MNIIECVDLRKEYLSGENIVNAVDGITVAFEQGEFCAITGPSGSGKSTLLHVLSSLENPTSGDVIYNGKKLSGYNDNQLSVLRRRRFGFVFQAYNLVQELTGYENIVLPVMLDKKKVDEAYINKVIDVLGIGDRLEHLPSALSGGQQQRIAIARALANKPSILFADEPTGNLDPKSANDVMELFCRVVEQGCSVVMATHNIQLVSAFPARALMFRKGRVEEFDVNSAIHKE